MSKRSNSSRMNRSVFLLTGWFFLASRHAMASEVATNSLRVSTISAPSGATGITFSSSVRLLPNNSITLNGAAGAIVLASSVTASSFWGDGGSLTNTNNAVLSATQTFSGANTFTSSFTVQSFGRTVALSTGGTTDNLTLSSNGTVLFSPELHNSSHTLIPNASTTNTSLGSCVDGSTLTITTTGGNVEVTFTGARRRTTSGGLNLSVLQDGQFPPGFDSTTGIARSFTLNAYGSQVCFSYLFSAVGAGTHSYCLTFAALGGGTAELLNDSSTSNIFYVKELK